MVHDDKGAAAGVAAGADDDREFAELAFAIEVGM